MKSVQISQKMCGNGYKFHHFSTHLERLSLSEEGFFPLCADSRQILSCEYNRKGNLMSISVRLYYDFIWLNGSNRRVLHLVRKSLKSHRWLLRHLLSHTPCILPIPVDNI